MGRDIGLTEGMNNMENDLISRQGVIEVLSQYPFEKVVNCISIIEEFPSVQTNIVRCKDCKHWFDIDDGRQKHRMCADVNGDWFCGDAERRTDEQ